MKTVPSIARLVQINPGAPRHAWVHPQVHVYHCAWCELTYVNTEQVGVWVKVWQWPDNDQRYQGAPGQSPPTCTGPRRQRRALLAAVAAGSIRSPETPSGPQQFFVDGREPYPVTEQIGRARRDELVYLTGRGDRPLPELTERGEKWLAVAADYAEAECAKAAA